MTNDDARTAECRRLCDLSSARWIDGDGNGAWTALSTAEELAADDVRLGLETASAHATLALRAEDYDQALHAAEECIETSAGIQLTGTRQVQAVYNARVCRGTVLAGRTALDTPDADNGLRELDEVAERCAESHPAVAIRAINNSLLVRLRQLYPALAERDSNAEVEAWMLVEKAVDRAHAFQFPGIIVRQAVDLALHAGNLARGLGYLTHQLTREPQRTERIALSSKAALFAWEGANLGSAREYGNAAVASSVAVDVPWVRMYAFLGGVIAAAAGAGSVLKALGAYERCTSIAGHATRPQRAWEAAQVALEAGLSPTDVEAFLARTHPAGFGESNTGSLSRIVLADYRNHDPFDIDLSHIETSALYAADRARLHLASARSAVRHGRHTAALVELKSARADVREWPGRVSNRIDTIAADYLDAPEITAAQQRVLDLLVEGLGNQAIADSLECSVRTVAIHVSRLLQIYGARSRTELAVQEVRRRMSASS